MKIIEIIHNVLPRTSQIQQEAVYPELRVLTSQPQQTNTIEQSSTVMQTRPQKRQVSTRPIPNQIKHKLIQDKLTKNLMRQTNIIKPTADDIQIAKDRVASEIKRSDLQYHKNIDKLTRNR